MPDYIYWDVFRILRDGMRVTEEQLGKVRATDQWMALDMGAQRFGIPPQDMQTIGVRPEVGQGAAWD